jgi:formiminotetrahydrofolate cyclodeaminase
VELGVGPAFQRIVSAIKKDGQALPKPLKEDRTARAQTMLKAHEALIKTAPENLPKFKDVIQYPRGRVAFVEIAFPPNLKAMRSVL